MLKHNNTVLSSMRDDARTGQQMRMRKPQIHSLLQMRHFGGIPSSMQFYEYDRLLFMVVLKRMCAFL